MEQVQRKNFLVITGMGAVLLLLLIFLSRGFEHIITWTDAVSLAGMFLLIFVPVMAIFNYSNHPSEKEVLFIGTFVILSLLARAVMLDFNSADYDSFLEGWVDVFRQGGFSMLGENVGDYNLLYQYVLLIISKSSLFDLYLIKYFTIIFDYALALAMMRGAEIFGSKESKVPTFLLMCILPTTLLDGACWGQCDSVYAFFVIMSLCDLKTGHPWRSASFLSIAFAFKLQTIFFFPVVLLGLIHKEFKPKHALAFFAVYLLTMVPALLAGRPFLDALSVYVSQSMGQYYHRLTYNAPNLYIFFPMLEFASTQEYTWMRYIKGIDGEMTNAYLTEDLFPTLQNAALYACILLVLIVVIYWLMHAREVTPDMTLEFALFFAVFLPFVMPKVHDRYFYLADMLSILYAIQKPNRKFMPVLVVGASLMSYMSFLTRQRPVDERILALMMFSALLITAHDLLCGMRYNRAVCQEGRAA